MRKLLIIITVCFLVGCTSETSRDESTATYTWHQDVKPLVDNYCIRCHTDGNIGVGNFNDADTVFALADLMLARIKEGSMPPPVADPTCQDYVASEHLSVSAEDKAIFETWVAEGKPEGVPTEAETIIAAVEPELEDYDLELQISEPFTPTFSNENRLGNEYRCFILDPNVDETFYLTAMHPIIDKSKISHHAVIGKVPRAFPFNSGPDGFDCFDLSFSETFKDVVIGTWAPGTLPLIFDEGMGMKVRPSEVFLIQMHYFMSGPESLDQPTLPGYRFRTATSVEREVELITIGDYDFEIPAGASDHRHTATLRADRDYQVIGAFPHMHVLGSGYELKVEDSDACVVRADRYDFDNQLMYQLLQPVDLKQGETLSFTCRWDNSAENPDQINETVQDVVAGEYTNQEMCFAFALVVKD